MKQLSLITSGITQIIRKIFAYYVTISFVLVMITLMYCVISIQQIFSLESDDDYRTEQMRGNVRTSFDNETIKKIEKLRTTNDQSQIGLPSGRYNPFVE